MSETDRAVGSEAQPFGRSSYASGIYGTIVAASVLAASYNETFHQEMLLVIVTVLVYWVAEQYADLLAHSLIGNRPNRSLVIAGLRRGWPMVQASYVPVGVLVVAWLTGLSLTWGVNLALGACVLVLAVLGWLGGRRRRLRLRGCLLSASIAGGLGVVMVLLKVVLHH